VGGTSVTQHADQGEGSQPGFGGELRRLRGEAGLSLRELAYEVQYDPGHLSRIERGLRPPNDKVARMCDRVLDAKGRLLALLPDDPAAPARPEEPDPAATDREREPRTRSARHLGGGAGARSTDGGPAAEAHEPYPGTEETTSKTAWIPDRRDSAAVAEAFANAAWGLRLLGRQVPAHVVLPTVIEQVHSLREMAVNRRSTNRVLLRLAGHIAEFAGWMAQESGDTAAARYWTAEAGRLASCCGFHDLRGYSRVRRAELEMYAGRADAVVELCEHVQHGPRYSPRVRAFAAYRGAQGHAMRGEVVATLRALEQGRELWLAQPDQEPDILLLGSATIGDPGPMVTGWCWLELGRPRLAAELLSAALGPAHTVQGRRVRALFGSRAARALAEGGELQEAVALGRRSMWAAAATGSATARGELRLLALTLERAPHHPAATDLARKIRSLCASVPEDGGWCAAASDEEQPDGC
jgi:transcriptional regulator with XRE-family HTH domain